MNMRSVLAKAYTFRFAVGILLTVIAFGCIKMPLDPILPASDIQMSIPIIDRTRTVAELYSKPASNVSYDSTLGTYAYKSTQASKPTPLDTLKATPRNQSSTVALGTITLPGLPSTSQAYTASQMGVPTGPVPGPPIAVTLPSQSIKLAGVSIPAPPNSQFDWLAIDTGSVTLSVTNTLPLQITFPQGLRLKNNSVNPPDTNTFAFFNLGVVDSGATVVRTVSLTKKLIYSALQTDSVKFTTNSRTGPFTVSSSAGVTFTFSSGSFVVDSAAAVIPNQVIVPTTDSLFTVDDSVVVETADFRSGTFNAVIQNHSNVTVAMYLRFTDLINTQTSASFVINQNLAPNSLNSYPVNLAQYKISTTPSTLGTKLSFRLGINSIQSAAKVPITSHDYISSGIQVGSPFVIKSVYGKIKPTTLAVNTGTKGFGTDVLGFTADSVNFSQQSLTLNLGFYSGFVMDYNLTLRGISRSANKTVTYTVPPPSGAGSQHRLTPDPSGTQLTQIVLDNSTGFNTFLKSFFPALPDTFILSGTVTLNPPDVFASAGGYQTINDTSKLYSSIGIFFPMKMGISNAQYKDVISIKGTFDSSFVSDVKSGSLYFSIDNGLPLSFGFLASFEGLDNTIHARRTFLTIPTNGTPQVISGGTVNTTTGMVSGSRTTSFQISLVSDEIQQLVAADSVAMVFQLSTSNAPTPIVLSASDLIHVRASATMVYTVNKKKN
jgi:hypothetical protein